ncbi:uncharacterized protein SPAPADRAFT_63096 [Spathaspora passalidarum NRRL Y-27907]|uniref:Aminotransferase class I/classII large domain-containing protein n=1 Tax=Spathaspora passalidarum (strain NRRL Y-27907 / 11-Y1) TaxID=619300 RepID=G3AUG9_SPAPN|nr:uncharacterized protein SPAPADRAFT_63096 [Spathaspora passalidarum NRRL Y-27907]EGW30254.1 hypothetical protein SPAPADRAFT_63096 [Spathaspora passalidarum NRRL Y-27907]
MSKVINFFKGHPTRQLLPAKEIAASYQKILTTSDYLEYDTDPANQHPLTYGTDPGNLAVRETISKWVDKKFNRTTPSDPDCINLTSGASYGIANILTSVSNVNITKRIFIVAPTYFLINNVFIDLGYEGKLTGINETHGQEYEIDLKYLEQQLELYSEGLESVNERTNVVSDPNRGERKYYRFVMYLVPTFSNPGGLSYSLKTRTKLVELARKYDLLIISDDVYELLDYTNVPLISKFNHIDRDSLTNCNTYGNTISNATFSKIIAPGLRVGWQETATPKLVAQLAETGANKSGGTPAQLSTLVVADLIQTGEIEKIISKFIETYSERAKVLKDSVSKYLPQGTKVFGGDGGYFLWVELPITNHQEIVDILAKKHSVILAGGEHFEVTGDERHWGENCVRLSISFLSKEEIQEGIKLWGDVLKEKYSELY